jgi:hypothetical protein
MSTLHFLIADSIVQLFKLRIAKAELCHPFRQALPKNVVVLQFSQSLRVHIAGEAVGSELVGAPRLSDGAVGAGSDASGAGGDTAPVEDEDVLADAFYPSFVRAAPPVSTSKKRKGGRAGYMSHRVGRRSRQPQDRRSACRIGSRRSYAPRSSPCAWGPAHLAYPGCRRCSHHPGSLSL